MRGLWHTVLRAIGYPVDEAPPEPIETKDITYGYTSADMDADARSDDESVESDAPDGVRTSTALAPVDRAYVAFQAAELARLRAGHKLNAEIARSGRTGMRPVALDGDTSTSWGSRAPATAPLVGGRLTVNSSSMLYKSARTILPPPDHLGAWRMEDLDSNSLDKKTPAEMLDLLANLSPEVSRALWDFLRLTNAGYEYHAYRVGTETEDKKARAALDAFLDALKDEHGSFDVVVNRLFIGAFMRGALFAELVLDANGKYPLDIATPDPVTVRFRLVEDPVRGQTWEMGQLQSRDFVPLDRETIKYIPIDPFPGSPYGRPLVSPALFSTLFLVGLLHDLRRVISQQGYPRIDVVVMIDKIISRMPPENRTDQEEVEKWIEAAVKDIRDVYKNLQPDDALVHDDGVEVKGPIGTVDSSSLGSIDGVIAMLERMAVRALKSMPLMMGITDGVSEANANRQWEIFIAGIKSVQHHAETLLERLLELSLQCQGIVADVRFRFSEVRSAEELRDQQTLAAKIENYARMRNEGWISQDEASNVVIGHDAEEEAPITTQVAANEDAVTNDNPEPGSARKARTPLDDVNAFREHMRSEGYGLMTEYAPSGRRPVVDPGDAALRTGFYKMVGGVRYDEWDIYRRVDPVQPAGAPEGTVPTSVSVDATDADAAVALFDRNMEDYKGLLDASVETNGVTST